MMRALKCAYGLGVEGGHRIANWLLEGSRPGASQLRIEALFSVGVSAKNAPNGRENQGGRPKHKAIPLRSWSHRIGRFFQRFLFYFFSRDGSAAKSKGMALCFGLP